MEGGCWQGNRCRCPHSRQGQPQAPEPQRGHLADVVAVLRPALQLHLQGQRGQQAQQAPGPLPAATIAIAVLFGGCKRR